MKTKTITCLLTMLAIVFSCSTDIDDTTNVPENNENVCTMHLNGSVVPFDYSSLGSRATTSYSWNNGDKLYIIFTTPSGNTSNGTATYNATTRAWDVTYTSALVRDKSTSCKVYFFEGYYETMTSTVKLSENNGIYSDTNASYSYPLNGDLTITATLKPSTSRIRFKGTVGETLSISGLKFYTEYSIGKNTLSTSLNATITSTVGSNGYTPYIYGIFDNSSEPTLTLSYKSFTFSANCTGQSMLIVGKSGWMNVPEEYSHNGWTLTRANGTLNGHEYVDLGLTSGNLWATCNIGANNPEEEGGLYQWGAVSTDVEGDVFIYRDKNSGQTYITKYCTTPAYGYNGFADNKTKLDLSDDAAYVNWGISWNMPTVEDYDELRLECSNSSSIRNGVKGTLFLSKKNGNTVFFPWINGSGGYWTNTLSSFDFQAIDFGVGPSEVNIYPTGSTRSIKQMIRPIVNKQ